MRNNHQRYLLKIFSGLHAGAQVPLTDGEYRIGGSDECDFILEDGAAGDLALRIGLDSGRMTVIEAKGLCYLDGEPISPEGLDLEAYQVITLGATHLALGPRKGKWPDFSPPQIKPSKAAKEAETDEMAPAAPNAADNKSVQADGTGMTAEGKNDASRDGNPDADDSELTSEQTMEEVEKRRTAATIKKIGVCAAAVCFVFVFVQQCFFHSTSPSRKEALARAQKSVGHLLEKYHVSGATIKIDEENRLVVSGFLERASDKNALSRQLEKIAFPKTVNLMAIEESLSTFEAVLQGYRLRLKVAHQGEGVFVISGFVRDKDLLRALLARLREDMPLIRQIKTRVHTHDDIIPAVFKELEKSGGIQGRIELQAHADHIRVEGTFFPGDREVWDDVQANIHKRFGEDIRFKDAFIVQPGPASKIASSPVKKRTPLDELAELKGQITGVILSPRQYLLTRDGKKCFEGGLLAGGYIVNSIKPDKIVLVKGGNNISIPLLP